MNIIEILGKIGFDWRMALANLVNFLIIFWLLKKYAFAPIQKSLKNRQDKVKKGIEDSKKAEAQAVMAEQNYKQKMEAARKDADGIVATAHDQSKKMIQKSRSQADSDAELIRERARTDIEKERQEMESGIKEHASDIAISIAEKILKKEVDKKLNESLVSDIVKQSS